MNNIGNTEKEFINIAKIGGIFVPQKNKILINNTLESGVYEIGYNHKDGSVYFTNGLLTTDKLMDLPNEEYFKIISEIDTFLDPKSKAIFESFGFIYKRNILLHGQPGTGKTCLVNRIASKVLEKNGIVLFNPDINLLPSAFNVLNDLQPNILTLVIFEEMDTLLDEQGETPYLNILDGEVQKDNVMYIATTNYIDRIPNRIKRPGRFASTIEVKFPTMKTRKFYLEQKLKVNDPDIERITQLTEGFSIDELKEVVLSVKCLKRDLQESINKIRELNNKENLPSENFTNINYDDKRLFKELDEYLYQNDEENDLLPNWEF